MANELKAEIFEQMKDVLIEYTSISLDEITKDLSSDLKMDSLDKLGFAYEIEDKFNIRIPDEKISELETIKDYIEYISSHRNQ